MIKVAVRLDGLSFSFPKIALLCIKSPKLLTNLSGYSFFNSD